MDEVKVSRRGRKTIISQEMGEKIKELFNKGFRLSEISNVIGVFPYSVCYFLKKEGFSPIYSRGRPKMSERKDIRIGTDVIVTTESGQRYGGVVYDIIGEKTLKVKVCYNQYLYCDINNVKPKKDWRGDEFQ